MNAPLLATRNLHKVTELSALLGLTLRGLNALPGAPEVLEDGDSFEANALKKASELAAFAGGWVLADDSGLEVDALGGAPGVHSARYAGRHGDDAANNVKLLEALRSETRRGAQFRCVLALCGPAGERFCYEGLCRGSIATACRGAGGFGYDPLFIPQGHTQSFAELGAEVKNALSHRRRAVDALLASGQRPWERV